MPLHISLGATSQLILPSMALSATRHIATAWTRQAHRSTSWQTPLAHHHTTTALNVCTTGSCATLPLARSLHTSTYAAMPTRRVTPAELLERNASYPEELWVTDRDRIQANKVGQNPTVLWIGCSDSRVPESVVTRCKPGDIFVHRNIANQFQETDDSANSVLTFAVEALKVEHIIVVGHTSCGGVKASLGCAESDTRLPSDAMQRFLGPLLKLSEKVRSEAKDDSPESLLTKVTEANVKMQVDKIVASKVVQANWASKKSAFPVAEDEKIVKVEVHGWIHDVGTGKLRDIGITAKPPA